MYENLPASALDLIDLFTARMLKTVCYYLDRSTENSFEAMRSHISRAYLDDIDPTEFDAGDQLTLLEQVTLREGATHVNGRVFDLRGCLKRKALDALSTLAQRQALALLDQLEMFMQINGFAIGDLHATNRLDFSAYSARLDHDSSTQIYEYRRDDGGAANVDVWRFFLTEQCSLYLERKVTG